MRIVNRDEIAAWLVPLWLYEVGRWSQTKRFLPPWVVRRHGRKGSLGANLVEELKALEKPTAADLDRILGYDDWDVYLTCVECKNGFPELVELSGEAAMICPGCLRACLAFAEPKE